LRNRVGIKHAIGLVDWLGPRGAFDTAINHKVRNMDALMKVFQTHPDYRFRLVIDPILATLAAFALTSRREATVAETGDLA